ncbi:MAG: hypothetical protein A2648_02775 [Candidatus Lloydbacteria bacterium RIFCSPHIGHO2_01_FULL_41_20]|uniref:Bacterial spore germination immunoglobulin-like domain-containing protein n=1 Tax=Candidatus Lloydbacteria bacterium RIFCSPHIGHO2_01_FULL_41_20 TaxID=1798657 RepID=A0A1G2CVI4_9BACT|nr:MAG: hypothetical protein A2648_02775 [Candidatus Lloydbacteria bacterium RIFCSPHIGHO2_01_FULL_41_20]
MKGKTIFITIAVLVTILWFVGFFLFIGGKASIVKTQPMVNDKILITLPLPNSIVKNPLTVKGEARGNWYFEASFPVKIFDSNEKQLGIIPAQAKGDWMTTAFVPFEANLFFELSTTESGTLVLEKDNPSGLPEHDDSISIPIRFEN